MYKREQSKLNKLKELDFWYNPFGVDFFPNFFSNVVFFFFIMADSKLWDHYGGLLLMLQGTKNAMK